MLDDSLRLAAHVPIGSSLLINGVAELQAVFDSFGTEIEQLVNLAGYLTVAHADMAATVSIHEDIDGTRHADGVAYLHQHLVRHTGSYQILGNVAGSICCAAVYLRRVFAGESAAAVGTLAAVGIYNNLAPRQPGVTVRTTDYELARGIDVVCDMVVEQCQHLFMMDGSNNTRHQNLDYIPTDLSEHFFISLELCGLAVVGRLYEVVVLGGDYDGVDAYGRAVVIIFDGHLALGIGTEVGHHLAFATDVGQHLQDAVCKVQRKRHVVLRFVGGIAEHHSLVSGTLLHRVLTLHAAVDVGALLVDGAQHAARVALEHVLAFGIADFLDYFACDEGHVNVRFGFHFSSQHYLPGSNQSFASYF